MISLDHEDLQRIQLREIATDLKIAPFLPLPSKLRKERNWAPLFFSKDFLEEHKEIKVEDFELSTQVLKSLGIEVSKARERFR